jgi:hypothetical protein
MKIKFHLPIFMALLLAVSSCKKDNYDEPSSTLSGRLVYNGEPVEVEANAVSYQLFQPGFGKTGPIGSSFAQDGTYSALLFNGNYKFTIPAGQGPFIWSTTTSGSPDSIAVTVNGDQTLDIDVTPYYMIRNTQATAASGIVTATCAVERIITDANARDIERVILFINKTQFVSGGDNIASADIAGVDLLDPNNVSLSASIPAIVPTQNYVFARIGVKIVGVEDLIFSSVQRVEF